MAKISRKLDFILLTTVLSQVVPCGIASLCILSSATPAFSQTSPITAAPDGTGTLIAPNGQRFDITGGKTSNDGANLFHSFQQFGLSQDQIANFISNPNIKNIFGRVVGGDASLINGLIQVTGGSSNLFLVNPAGIIFGANAQLNVPAAFTATTANGIGFGTNWFKAVGVNDYAALTGTPSAFAFTGTQSGGIVNFGNLTVQPGQSLSFLGGAVLNLGELRASAGEITIAAIPGKSLVKVSQPGHLLSIEVQPIASPFPVDNPSLPAAAIPQLLTGIGKAQASSIQVNPDGTLQLTSGQPPISIAQGTAIASGKINVAGTTGGSIQVLGQNVGV
ncbi:MAG: filamentous hemagglutinin N-terminal domain-containing protein, partial [Actinomycetota bacterium]